MRRTLSAVAILLLIISLLITPAFAAAGDDGSGGTGSGESGGYGNGGEQAGNAGSKGVPASTGGPEVQIPQEEQQRRQQDIPGIPGVQVNQQDRDQVQGRTNFTGTNATTSADLIRQRDNDLFLRQVHLQEQNLSRDQDQARVDAALYVLSISSNVTGSSGSELIRLAGEVNNSFGAEYKAEQEIKSRNSFIRLLLGGDREAAGLLIQYTDQNQQRIRQMEQLVADCTGCDPQVRVMLEEQVQVLSREENRLTSIAQQELGEKGLFGWFPGGSAPSAVSGQITALTVDEQFWLKYMREEEKLARDVYLSLGSRWGLPIFSNIARSEQMHMDSVKTLLDRYGIPDPAAGNAPGVYTNPDLQKLYDSLIAKGSVSQVEALRVGKLIEETDIADLNKAIATTTHADIRAVYSNLLSGSGNHLNAFESNLAGY